MSDQTVIQLALKPGSLDELLAGEYATRFWLHRDPEDPEGTYRLASLTWAENEGAAGADSGMALLRVLCGDDVEGRQPPIQPPTAEVAEQMVRWQAFLETLEQGGGHARRATSGARRSIGIRWMIRPRRTRSPQSPPQS